MNELYGIVRKVALQQCGQFMMGVARIGGKTIILSGTYGADGLAIHDNKLDYKFAVKYGAKRIPDELYQKWANGGGWNSAGSEAEDMRKWARENFHKKEK